MSSKSALLLGFALFLNKKITCFLQKNKKYGKKMELKIHSTRRGLFVV